MDLGGVCAFPVLPAGASRPAGPVLRTRLKVPWGTQAWVSAALEGRVQLAFCRCVPRREWLSGLEL